MKKELSIILPVFNEKDSLPIMVRLLNSTIKFKKEDVKCDIDRIRLTDVGLNLNRGGGNPSSPYKKGDWKYYADCTANGIKTNLVGNEYVYNGEEWCNSRTKTKITCRAAVYFGRFNYDQVD